VGELGTSVGWFVEWIPSRATVELESFSRVRKSEMDPLVATAHRPAPVEPKLKVIAEEEGTREVAHAQASIDEADRDLRHDSHSRHARGGAPFGVSRAKARVAVACPRASSP